VKKTLCALVVAFILSAVVGCGGTTTTKPVTTGGSPSTGGTPATK